MRIRMLPSTMSSGSEYQFAMSYLINDCVVIDAGSIGFAPMSVQRSVQHVFLSHAHADHTASLPIFLDNIYAPGPNAVSLYADDSTWQALQKHVFNNVIWPDFIQLSSSESPFLHYHCLTADVPVEVAGLTIQPVLLDHLVPTLGFIVDDGTAAVAIVSDTSPTTHIWNVARLNRNLKAVFLEASFPNEMQWLADKSQHLTPATFIAQMRQADLRVPFYAIHIKPASQETIISELKSYSQDGVCILEPDRDYEF